MSLFVGDKKATFYHGDHHPAELWGPDVGVKTTGKNLCSNIFSEYRRPHNYWLFDLPIFAENTDLCFSAKKIGNVVENVVVAYVPFGEEYYDFSSVMKGVVNTSGNARENVAIRTSSKDTSPKIAVYASNEYVFNSIFKNYEIQLELGPVATPYEPYTGGKPGIYHELVRYAGFDKVHATGTGRVELGTQPYKASLPSVTVHGEGKQDKLEGKNLIPYPYEDIKSGESVTINGVTFTELSDRSIKISGRPHNEARLVLARKKITDKSGGSYRGQDFVTVGQYSFQCPYLYSNISRPWVIIDIMPTHFTGEKEIIVHPMITLGSIKEPYEPYCGGIPAPNPQYPIEPVFLEGASVGLRGRNLAFFPETKEYQNAGMTISIDKNGVINASGTGERGQAIVSSQYLPKGVYTLSILASGLVNDTPLSLNSFSRSGSREMLSFKSSGEAHITFENEPYKLALYLNSGVICEDARFKIMLTKGSTPTPYTPYYDGGTAPLPILRALPDGSFRESFNAVTGNKDSMIFIELDGSEDEGWKIYHAGDTWFGFYTRPLLPRKESRAAFCSNYVLPQSAGEFPLDRPSMWVGVNDSNIFYIGLFTFVEKGELPFYDDSLPDKGLANWKQHLKEHPLRIWYVPGEKYIEHCDPAILRQHPGYTQLIQQGGFREAEIEAEYYKEVNG